MTDSDRNQKYSEAKESLPEHLRKEFDELVEDYRFAAHVRYGKQFVSYAVLADLVRAGWRRTAGPIDIKNSEEKA